AHREHRASTRAARLQCSYELRCAHARAVVAYVSHRERSLLGDADFVPAHRQRARHTDERNWIARHKTAGHDVDDLSARFAGRDRALERDAVVALLRPDDERVVRAVVQRRHEPYRTSCARDVRSALKCIDVLATSSHDARNEWWISRAMRDECLTLQRECV